MAKQETKQEKQKHNGHAEPLVVLTRDFAPILNEYLERWDSSFRSVEGEHVESKWSTYQAKPVDILAQEAGVDVRRIFAFRKQEQPTITFRVFDKLISAMGMPYLVGEIPVYRNPLWSLEKFMRWLEEQDLTIEDLGMNLNVTLSEPVPWAVTS